MMRDREAKIEEIVYKKLKNLLRAKYEQLKDNPKTLIDQRP